ncbi:hypothetical protein EKH84_17280 [Cellulosilyticum sp. WCF-2]|nr:hypothetical protein EKH84_17280 [Cellulosilyticum sp. WCF-2]
MMSLKVFNRKYLSLAPILLTIRLFFYFSIP